MLVNLFVNFFVDNLVSCFPKSGLAAVFKES